MKKVKTALQNRALKIVLAFVIVLALVLLFLQLQAKNAVAEFLERKIPSHINLVYKGLDVNLLTGNVHFSDISLQLMDRDSALTHTAIKADQLNIGGLGYWQFFARNTIKATELSLHRPQVLHYASRILKKESSEPQGVVNLLKKIDIGKIAITDGSFEMTRKKDDSLQIKARNINFSLINGRTGPDVILKKIPIEYGNYEFAAENIFVDLGPYETVTADTLVITKTDAVLKNTVLKSKYSKRDLSRVVPREHDHIDLRIPEFHLRGIGFGFEGNNFFFSSRFGEIFSPYVTIYRDKLVFDDSRPKRMYSTMLREIPIHIAIDSLKMTEGQVQYEENSNYATKAGNLSFNELDLSLYNINNGYPDGGNTVAKIKGKLMGVAPITIDYRFDMNRKDDAFALKATLFALNGEHVNSFLRPNLNAQIKGQVEELYLTASGNNIMAKGNMKMKYQNLKFEILKKDRLRINKLLSAIGNIFVNDGSDADAKGYRYGTIEAERDHRKSFFNFIWLITQDGLLSTLTGDGKKEKK